MTCTCPTPADVVDLTEAYASKHNNKNCDANSASSHCQSALLANLERYGWSHISIKLSDLPESSPLLLQGNFWKDPKPAILGLFDPAHHSSFPNASFYAAESGAVGESIEPKHSWEVRRCSHYNKQEQTDRTILDQITLSMHSIISTVNWVLKLAPNLLFQEDTDTYGCSCNTTDYKGPCNVDLLRVFHYEKVTPNSDQEILGSSPHTDWGSWTVVWQDNVGGLQTHCPSCNTWQDVPAFEREEDTLHFVIHVGDATSLAMAQARLQQQSSTNPSPTKHTFPSPKHRVLSPLTESRASLVYFVYPPPSHSLESLAKGLSPWVQKHPKQGSSPIPYEQYYLLLDQSATPNGTKRTPKEVFDAVYSKPMHEVFVKKWQQVQRSS